MLKPSTTPVSRYCYTKTSPTSSDRYEKKKRNEKKLLVQQSPSITTFYKAQSTDMKFYFNTAFRDNVISILQQQTRNDSPMLSPGSGGYTTSFKPVISSY